MGIVTGVFPAVNSLVCSPKCDLCFMCSGRNEGFSFFFLFFFWWMKYLFSQHLCLTALEKKAATEANTLMTSRKLFKAASCIMQKKRFTGRQQNTTAVLLKLETSFLKQGNNRKSTWFFPYQMHDSTECICGNIMIFKCIWCMPLCAQCGLKALMHTVSNWMCRIGIYI